MSKLCVSVDVVAIVDGHAVRPIQKQSVEKEAYNLLRLSTSKKIEELEIKEGTYNGKKKHQSF